MTCKFIDLPPALSTLIQFFVEGANALSHLSAVTETVNPMKTLLHADVPRGMANRGFTLIEAALTTAIVGTGVLSIMAAQQAYLRKNDWAQRAGTENGCKYAEAFRKITFRT